MASKQDITVPKIVAASSSDPPPAATEVTSRPQLDGPSYSEPRLGDTSLGPEHEERLAFSSSAPTERTAQRGRREHSSLERPDQADGDGQRRWSRVDTPFPPIPPHPQLDDIGTEEHPDPRRRPLSMHRASRSRRRQSGIDWIVPMSVAGTVGGRAPTPLREKTVGERLDPTLTTAVREKEKYALNARITGYALNAAIGMQVLLGSLTTGLSVVISGRQAQVVTAVLGGFATLVASYLARARGSNEPELSIARVKDLEQFIRECEAFKMDHGHDAGGEYDADLLHFRKRFEELLGNANGERKLSPPV